MAVDLDAALPSSMSELAFSDEVIVVKATFRDWKTLRGAHETVVAVALDDGNLLKAMVGQHIGHVFVEEVSAGSVPPISEGNEPDESTELAVTLKLRTFAAVATSLAVVKAQDLREDLDENDEKGKDVLDALDHAWSAFQPQLQPWAPGFGTGIE